MFRPMINMGHLPRKVWIDHSYGSRCRSARRTTRTATGEWGWHVAPTLWVRGPSFLQTQRMVTTLAFHHAGFLRDLEGARSDPAATLTDGVADQFWHGGGTDPTYSASNQFRTRYRLALLNRSNQLGPPRYANCH